MEKIAVIYWSQTGNTEAMAKSIAEGVESSGAEVKLCNVSDIDSSITDEYSKLILGCPSMGSEVLEEGEFEPFFDSMEGKITGKKIALFGSYGWGDGEWMRDWESRVSKAGATLFESGKIINETPDDSSLKDCFEFGKRFAIA